MNPQSRLWPLASPAVPYTAPLHNQGMAALLELAPLGPVAVERKSPAAKSPRPQRCGLVALAVSQGYVGLVKDTPGQ